SNAEITSKRLRPNLSTIVPAIGAPTAMNRAGKVKIRRTIKSGFGISAKISLIAGKAGEIVDPAITVRVLATNNVTLSRRLSGLFLGLLISAAVDMQCPYY